LAREGAAGNHGRPAPDHSGAEDDLMDTAVPAETIDALRLFALVLADARRNGRLPGLVLAAIPWTAALPEAGRARFLQDLVEAVGSGARAPERLAATMRDWHATAELYADKGEAERLRRAIKTGSEGLSPWEYDDESS
jgi:hypothetical protein